MNKKVIWAFDFARKAHKGQKRKGTNEDYITHSIEVYNILKRLTDDDDVLSAALLHDVIEDTKYTYNDIKELFGKRVVDIVLEVTRVDGKFNIKTREGLMVKLADMLHNIHDNNDEKYLKQKIRFIKKFI